jgi:hypothetical protein
LTSCAVVGRLATNTMSAIDPTGMGARTAIPSNLLASSGTARVVARRSGRGGHQVGCTGAAAQEVLAGTVDEPLAAGVGVDGRHHRALNPNVAVGDLDDWGDGVRGAAGAGDDLGAPSGWLTPCTTVGNVSDVVGAESITNEAPAEMCFFRPSSLLKTAVGPRQVRRITFGERRDPPTVDQQRPSAVATAGWYRP